MVRVTVSLTVTDSRIVISTSYKGRIMYGYQLLGSKLVNITVFVLNVKMMARLEPIYRVGATWRSRFSFNEPVPFSGPTAETSFVSGTFPGKPSSAGSVLSRDLVELLVRHSGDLKSFATLSSSLSLWMAPFAPDFIYDHGFSSVNTSCTKSSVAVAPFGTKKEILKAWQNYNECGRICLCKKQSLD